MRDLSDERFRYAVDLVLRNERFFPPPSVVIAAGYGMPIEAGPTRPALPVREDERTWASPEQAQHVAAVVKANPITEIERNGGESGAMNYIRRIAITSGLMEDDEAPKVMPREPGEEG